MLLVLHIMHVHLHYCKLEGYLIRQGFHWNPSIFLADFTEILPIDLGRFWADFTEIPSLLIWSDFGCISLKCPPWFGRILDRFKSACLHWNQFLSTWNSRITPEIHGFYLQQVEVKAYHKDRSFALKQDQ